MEILSIVFGEFKLVKKSKLLLIFLFLLIVSYLSYRFVSNSISSSERDKNKTNECVLSLFDDLEFKTESILFYNVNSDSILYEKNANQRRSPASITKIMTYIIAHENISDKNKKVVVEEDILKSIEGTQSSLANLQLGEEYSVSDLLLGMMVPSGNDAALVLANYTFQGDIGLFINKMNEKAFDLGCKDTHFSNPHGLYDENHYTTCYDLLKIINYALKIREFRDTVKICETELKGEKIKNSNMLLDKTSKYYCRYIKGIKTGYHSQAGCCLSSLAEYNGVEYIGILLGAPFKDEKGKKLDVNHAFEETESLCDYAFGNLQVRRISILENPKLKSKKLGLDIPYYGFNSIDIVVPFKNFKTENLRVSFDFIEINEEDFPINKGDKLGELHILYDNKIVKRKDLVCSQDINLSFKSKYIQLLKKTFAN